MPDPTHIDDVTVAHVQDIPRRMQADWINAILSQSAPVVEEPTGEVGHGK